MEILLVGALLGLITGAIAQSKGRSFFAWWLYGTLIFIVAIVHVLIIKPDRAEIERKAISDGDARKCPHCAELIKREAKVCRFCGRDVEPTGAVPVAAAALGEGQY